MRICILEWISGGGVYGYQPDEVPVGLCEEGWAMLECLCHDFCSEGHEVSTIIDGRLVSQERQRQLASQLDSMLEFSPIQSASVSTCDASAAVDAVLDCWRQTAIHSDLTLVVAPEIDGILQRCITYLIDCGVSVLNCTGGFLKAASDKGLAAELLVHRQIPHPETWSAEEFPVDRLERAERWCVKPRRGAGCQGLRIYPANQLELSLPTIRSQPALLIQPWIEGRAFSKSAVIDLEGQVHWLPLVTQELTFERPSEYWETLCYRGAKIVDSCLAHNDLSEILSSALDAMGGFTACDQFPEVDLPKSHCKVKESTSSQRLGSPLEALGWVGFDLVMDHQQQWNLVEVNARLTSSVVLLRSSGCVQLAKQLLKGYNVTDPSPWKHRA